MLLRKLRVFIRGLMKSGVRGAVAGVSLANRAEKKHFHDEYSCSLLAHGECPVYRLSRDDLFNLKNIDSDNAPTDENYCKFLAMKLISNKKEDACFLEHNPGDGRHRDCIADVLRSKDIDVHISVI